MFWGGLLLAGSASAADFYFFNGAGGDSLWTNEGNWGDNGGTPFAPGMGYPGQTNASDVIIARSRDNGKRAQVGTGDIINAEFLTMWGGSLPGNDGFDMSGGMIDLNNLFEMGSNGVNVPIEVNVSGGVINAAVSTLGGVPCCGTPFESDGTLNVSGTGQVNISGSLSIGNDSAETAPSDGILNLSGNGMVSVGTLNIGTVNNNGFVNISENALLKIDGDVTADIDAHIASGRIVGVNLGFDGQQTIVGVPEPSALVLIALGLLVRRYR